MVAISVKSDVKRFSRRLTRVQRRQLPFAVSLAINKTLPQARQIVHDEWQRQYADSPKRRKSFPRQVLRWKRSSKANLVGVLMNIADDDVLRLQQRGGVRRAKSGNLRVPASDGPRRSSKTPYRAGRFLFFERRGKDKYAGVLVDKVDVPAKFNIEKAVAKIRVVFRQELEKAMAQALRTAR